MTIRSRRHWHLRASLFLAFLLVVSPLSSTIIRAQGPNPSEADEIPGGAELITVHARLAGIESTENDNWVPLVSILRDTLGDNDTENNRLRYVWPLTYTRPTIKQRLAAAIPFFYTRVENKEKLDKVPPPAIDLSAPENEVWNKIFWAALQNILLDTYGTPIKASTSSYRRNSSDFVARTSSERCLCWLCIRL
jgi:hypothetical protein